MTAPTKSKTRRSSVRFAVATLGLALLLAGCSSIIPGAERDPPTLFDLTPKSTFKKDLPNVRIQLVIETPGAAAGLTSSRIAIKQSPTTINYYAKSEWTDLAPRMVQTLLIESFENSSKIKAVGREASGLRSDYILKTELREFQAETFHGKTTPTVRVRINVKIVRMPARSIIAGRNFERTIVARKADLPTVVVAFDDALGKVLKYAVQWTLVEISKSEKRRRTRRY